MLSYLIRMFFLTTVCLVHINTKMTPVGEASQVSPYFLPLSLKKILSLSVFSWYSCFYKAIVILCYNFLLQICMYCLEENSLRGGCCLTTLYVSKSSIRVRQTVKVQMYEWRNECSGQISRFPNTRPKQVYRSRGGWWVLPIFLPTILALQNMETRK